MKHLSSNSNYLISIFTPFRDASAKHRSRMLKRIQVALAFVLSGLLHFSGEYHALLLHPPWRRYHLSGVFATFALQPLALALEDAVYWTAWRSRFLRQKLCLGTPNPHLFVKLVGFVWVIIWMTFTMSFYTVTLMDAGFLTAPANIPRGWIVGAARWSWGRL